MAYTLKLNIFRFKLYKIKNSYQRPMRGKMATFYDTEVDATKFCDFIKAIEPSAQKNDFMKVLFAKMITHFDNKFRKGPDSNKAVAVTNQEYVGYGSKNYTVWGMFKGGETDLERKVYSQNNATKDVKKIEKDDVPAVNYFYKLWMPYDGEDGILMIQSYTDMGCVASFKDQIEELFASLQYRPIWNRMIPQGFIDRYLKSSFIYKIRIEYKSVNADGEGAFASMRQVRKNTELTRLSIALKDLFSVKDYDEELCRHLENIVEFKPEDDKVLVFYKDENGKEAHATMGNLEEAMPTIILPDSLKDSETEIAIPEEMDKFTDGMLKEIKEQINYTPGKLN